MSSTKHKGNYSAIKSSENDEVTQRYQTNDGIHLNNLWSIWYGIICAFLQGYLAYRCLKEILGYSVLTWPDGLPYFELNCSLGLNGAVFLLLPIFFTVTILKIGNLANDGYKLGRQTSMCSREPPDLLGGSGGCGLFRYGGPTAPFIHIAIAFCLLVPKLVMEAKMVQSGFLPHEYVWHTDLDFLLHHNKTVVMSFTPQAHNSTLSSVMSLKLMAQKFYDSEVMTFTSANVTHTVMNTLKDIIGHDTHKSDGVWDSSISLEYINLIVALVIYSVRYPAMFWSTNKCLGMLFSFLLFINGLHIVLGFAGVSILYKVHVANIWSELPLKTPAKLPILSNAELSFGLYMLSTLLILASSVVMYFYGHTRFAAFINQQRDRKLITLPETASTAWVYFTHYVAFCLLFAIALTNTPLIHDYAILYRGSCNEVPVLCLGYQMFHLVFSLFIWVFLVMKSKWTFKIRISIGEAVIKESRSLRLIHSVHMNNSRDSSPGQQPLLIIGNGRTYTVSETSPKKAIMDVLQSAMVKKSKSNGSMATSEDLNEEVYWLRPSGSTSQSQKRTYFAWFRKKEKVPFEAKSILRKNRTSVIPGIDEDDGDYATLRELPLQTTAKRSVDDVSEEGKLLACVHDEEITYASTSQDFAPPMVHTDFAGHPTTTTLVRADSGILTHEELPGRSDSLSTDCSASPPEPPGSSHSESSSGVHSSESTVVMRKADLDEGGKPVVIRRRSIRPNPNEGVAEAILKEDPYGRATNMRMTSFMDTKGLGSSSSATLPHYPTQPSVQNVYNNCSTMPLPLHTSGSIPQQSLTNGNSCNVYPNRPHTTIPTHLNGVKLVANVNQKRIQNPIDHTNAKLEPIYTKINRATNELCHYSTRHS